ncbi:MAG TPA: hypothetical protein VIN60_00420, partial [Anaerolineales bacterium]
MGASGANVEVDILGNPGVFVGFAVGTDGCGLLAGAAVMLASGTAGVAVLAGGAVFAGAVVLLGVWSNRACAVIV